MSGHSKWATIKHKKGATDAKRAKVFAKLIRQVEVAAREGGPDPDMNPSLRTMFQKARDSSVPLDTIKAAIKRATGGADGVAYESITYEGYGPGGVAMIVEVLTDNRNRSGSEVKSTFTKRGGSMAEPGAVAWQFERKGSLLVDGSWRVSTGPTDLHAVRTAVEEAGFKVESGDLVMVAQNLVPLTEVGAAKKALDLLDALDDLDDVQAVYGNFDISDEVLEQLV